MTAVLSTPQAAAARPVGLPRLLPARTDVPTRLTDHIAQHGRVPYRGGPGLLVASLDQARLTGRGGAGFPAVRKMQAVIAARGRPVVVANGAEGEPASAKDKLLLWSAPHLVLDGLQLVAEAVGANVAYLYLHAHGALLAALHRALAERPPAGIDRVGVRLVEAPPRFLSGQETAVVARINGGDAVPTWAPVRVSERGVHGRPTLVHNVETLAQLALIARHGAAWFEEVGTPDEPGSLLTTVHVAGSPTVVREVPHGVALHELVPVEASRAVLVGGYHGAWVDAGVAASLTLSNAALRQHGAAVGAGVLAALPADRCGLAETARVMRYLAVESAGQCGACLNGLPRIAAGLTDLAERRAPRRVIDDLTRWSGLVVRRGACAHPDGSVRLLRSALTVFADEVDRHLNGRCTGSSATPFLPLPREVR